MFFLILAKMDGVKSIMSKKEDGVWKVWEYVSETGLIAKKLRLRHSSDGCLPSSLVGLKNIPGRGRENRGFEILKNWIWRANRRRYPSCQTWPLSKAYHRQYGLWFLLVLVCCVWQIDFISVFGAGSPSSIEEIACANVCF